MAKRLKDLVGQTFGRLKVLSRAKNNKHGNARWNSSAHAGLRKLFSAVICAAEIQTHVATDVVLTAAEQ